MLISPPALLPLGQSAVKEGHLDTCLTCHLATAARGLVHHPPLVIALALPPAAESHYYLGDLHFTI